MLAFLLFAVTVEWHPDAVEIHGVRKSCADCLVVTVEGQETPLAGTVSASGETVRFQPRFALQPGLTYRATWRDPHASAVYTVPKKDVAASARVAHVYPSANVLPANQLKLYVQFSASMSRGEAWRRIHLMDDQGKEVALPFLEIEEELWDREAKRLTVLFDPGRIKRGLVPNNEVGPALVVGRHYELVIDREWPDGHGTPMVEAYRKKFVVAEADREPIALAAWKVTASRNQLDVLFPEPLDAALLQRLLWVEDASGKRIEARTVSVTNDERRWTMQPETAFAPGNYKLVVGTMLEDLAGNRIDRKFDVDTFERVEMRNVQKTKEIPFTVAP